MKTLIQKPEVDTETSFACREYQTPQFESAWHKHEEYELIVITKGNGILMLGDYIGEYNAQEVYFIASNLPHWFRKQNPEMIGSALVTHFRKDIFGETFFETPEMKTINRLLKKNEGIKLTGELNKKVFELMRGLNDKKGYERMHQLLHSLNLIGSSLDTLVLTKDIIFSEEIVDHTIAVIFDFSLKHYLSEIKLKEVADIANMSIPTFCRFFKKGVKKTYFEFLQELRINHACKLLTDTDKPILEICYDSGFNSWGHFSKKFNEIKKVSPSKYRAEFTSSFTS